MTPRLPRLLCLPLVLASVEAGSPGARPPEPVSRTPDRARRGVARWVKVEDAPLLFTRQVFPDPRATDDRAQAESALDALAGVLAAAGAGPRGLVHLNAVVTTEAMAAALEAALADRFAGDPPAVSLSQGPVAGPGARLACDAVAALPAPTSGIRHLPGGSVAPAGGKVFVSGQANRGPDLVASVRLTMEALHRSLAKVGLTRADVVQVKAFIQPMTGHADARAEIERAYAGGPVPAIVLMEWLSGAPTEIELVAAAPQLRVPDGADPAAFHWLEGMPVSPYYCRIATVAAGRPLVFTGSLTGAAAVGARDQWLQGFQELAEILRDSGSSFRHLLKATYYLAEPAAREHLAEIRSVLYDPTRPPAASAIDVRGLGRPGLKVGLDLIAVPVSRAPAPPATGRPR